MNITIREINSRLWREAKSESVKEGLTMGQTVNIALEKFLKEHKSKKQDKKTKSFWDVSPYTFGGKDSGNLSIKVDEVVYGWKK